MLDIGQNVVSVNVQHFFEKSFDRNRIVKRRVHSDGRISGNYRILRRFHLLD